MLLKWYISRWSYTWVMVSRGFASITNVFAPASPARLKLTVSSTTPLTGSGALRRQCTVCRWFWALVTQAPISRLSMGASLML